MAVVLKKSKKTEDNAEKKVVSNIQKLKFKMAQLSAVDNKDWKLKLSKRGEVALNMSHSFYMVKIVVDDTVFDKQIQDKQNNIDTFKKKPDMFDEWSQDVEDLEKEIREVEEAREIAKSECPEEFSVLVEQVHYINEYIILQVPNDEVIFNLLKIRRHFQDFMVELRVV